MSSRRTLHTARLAGDEEDEVQATCTAPLVDIGDALAQASKKRPATHAALFARAAVRERGGHRRRRRRRVVWRERVREVAADLAQYGDIRAREWHAATERLEYGYAEAFRSEGTAEQTASPKALEDVVRLVAGKAHSCGDAELQSEAPSSSR